MKAREKRKRGVKYYLFKDTWGLPWEKEAALEGLRNGKRNKKNSPEGLRTFLIHMTIICWNLEEEIWERSLRDSWGLLKVQGIWPTKGCRARNQYGNGSFKVQKMIIGEVWPWTLRAKRTPQHLGSSQMGGKGDRQMDTRWGWGWGRKRALLKENPRSCPQMSGSR